MSALYDYGREGFLGGDIDWDSDDIRAILIDDADYVPNAAGDQFLSDIPAAARVSVSSSLTGKSITNGVADADDTIFSSVSGDPSEVIVLYQHTGTEGTSRLIAFFDGLSITPNGGDISVQWSNAENRIFKL